MSTARIPSRLPRSLGDAELLMRHDPGRWPLGAAGVAVLIGAGILARVDGWAIAAFAAMCGAFLLVHHSMRSGWYLCGYADGWTAKDDETRGRRPT